MKVRSNNAYLWLILWHNEGRVNQHLHPHLGMADAQIFVHPLYHVSHARQQRECLMHAV